MATAQSKLQIIIDVLTGRSAQNISKLEQSLTTLLAGVGAVTAGAFALGVAAKKVFEFGKEGASLLLVEERFNRLAESIGTTGDALLNDLGPAMGGMLSQSEMMAAATDLMALGLVKSHEEAIRLASVAGQLNMNMNQLVLTLTNMTTMRFDALGVSVDGFKDKVKALEAAGYSTNDAFKEAFLQQAEEQLERVGSAADTAAGEFAQLEANIKNLKDASKESVAEGLVPIIEKLNDQMMVMALLNAAMDEGVELSGEYLTWLYRGVPANTDLSAAIEDLNNLLGEQREKMADIALEAADADKAMLGYAVSTNEAASASEGLASATQEVTNKLEGVNTALDRTIDKYKEQINWVAAGGQQLVLEAERIIEAYGIGLINDEEAVSALNEIQIKVIDLNMELGKTSTDEAVSELVAMGYPIDAAKAKVAELQAKIMSLQGKDVNINIYENTYRTIVTGATGPIRRQHGGPVSAGEPYWVGEMGAELFVPSQSGKILPANQATGTPGGGNRGGGGKTVNIYQTNYITPRDTISGMVVDTITQKEALLALASAA